MRKICSDNRDHLSVANFLDGAAIGDELGEIDLHPLEFPERDPARPELLEQRLLLAGKRAGWIEVDGKHVSLLRLSRQVT